MSVNEYRKRWVEALRSGDYKQGRGQLHNRADNEFCCLGVACHLFAEEFGVPIEITYSGGSVLYDSQVGRLPRIIADALEMSPWADLVPSGDESGEYTLIDLNDDKGYTFDQIADLIEDPKTQFHWKGDVDDA